MHCKKKGMISKLKQMLLNKNNTLDICRNITEMELKYLDGLQMILYENYFLYEENKQMAIKDSYTPLHFLFNNDWVKLKLIDVYICFNESKYD